jgi:hypothetical protein
MKQVVKVQRPLSSSDGPPWLIYAKGCQGSIRRKRPDRRWRSPRLSTRKCSLRPPTLRERPRRSGLDLQRRR